MLDSRRNLLLACTLSALAGYVDGIGFLHLGGLFVSFMSGNSTRMGVSLAEGRWHEAMNALGLIGLFVGGAAGGSVIMQRRNRHVQSLLLLVEGALLITATLSHLAGLPFGAVTAIVVAMGLENAAFQIKGSGGLGLTYVTGALVKVGQAVAVALAGGPRLGWLSNLLLWAALVAGSAAGAFAYLRLGLTAVWAGACAALLIAFFAAVTADPEH
ncbi:conserved membrane hypothetical protein [Bradyrhizobium sp. ORS 375]|uniref:YoaK family protein n=1 Tax=Bradyrhizobium sp. (strain ORS 375) TaxID=566679 RepID=UPI000240A1D9|nr:YoaK family protein [Bradyrhizobium sp. ORS 375]CCD94021.1 conserved membrane hypothetical protein [Bradyrhizobium sp. ORS 375]